MKILVLACDDVQLDAAMKQLGGSHEVSVTDSPLESAILMQTARQQNQSFDVFLSDKWPHPAVNIRGYIYRNVDLASLFIARGEANHVAVLVELDQRADRYSLFTHKCLFEHYDSFTESDIRRWDQLLTSLLGD